MAKEVARPNLDAGGLSAEGVDVVADEEKVISTFREAEIDHLAISASEKDELKSGWKQWLGATALGNKDELRGEGDSEQRREKQS